MQERIQLFGFEQGRMVGVIGEYEDGGGGARGGAWVGCACEGGAEAAGLGSRRRGTWPVCQGLGGLLTCWVGVAAGFWSHVSAHGTRSEHYKNSSPEADLCEDSGVSMKILKTLTKITC